MRIIVTGGAGFIGSAVCRYLIGETTTKVVNVDKLTYAGNLDSLRAVSGDLRYRFVKADICGEAAIDRLFNKVRPSGVVHLAAETHVDRSIRGSRTFIETNVLGTYTLLEATRRYWSGLKGNAKAAFRFLHVSTDEVYGSLGPEGLFSESTPYNLSSPCSASKVGSDHLAIAWQRTYGLPVIVSNCSNNYGPFQFPEKLIPLMILNGLEGKPLPVYCRRFRHRSKIAQPDFPKQEEHDHRCPGDQQSTASMKRGPFHFRRIKPIFQIGTSKWVAVTHRFDKTIVFPNSEQTAFLSPKTRF